MLYADHNTTFVKDLYLSIAVQGRSSSRVQLRTGYIGELRATLLGSLRLHTDRSSQKPNKADYYLKEAKKI